MKFTDGSDQRRKIVNPSLVFLETFYIYILKASQAMLWP